MKLNQLIAIEKGLKSSVAEKLTKIYHTLQKPDLFTGHTKTYTPRDEDPTSAFGEKLPDESKKVQFNAAKLLQEIATAQAELIDATFARDVANCHAVADVVVDGQVVFAKAPVSFLLWLEKRLNDLQTEYKKVPTLDTGERWTADSNQGQGMYVTEPVETGRTKKTTQPLILYPATDKHPAQVKEITEDVRAGTWKTTKQSAALPVDRKEVLLSRIEKLHSAVKYAREEANSLVVDTIDTVSTKMFDFILAP